MSWFFLALVGHLANAAAFIIDKSLLSTAWKHSATYAALVGTLSLFVLLAVPWVEGWPVGRALVSSAIFGGVFVLAIWAFFEALRRAEASRVVPIIGSLIPMFTLLGTSRFLGEQLTLRILLGFLCLLVATWALARGSRTQPLDKVTFGVAVLSAVLFAVASVGGKYAFIHADFWGVLVTSRIFAVLTGIGIGLHAAGARQELHSLLFTKKRKASPRDSFGLTLIGQTLGALGFLLVNAAIAKGSAAIVNALQAVQYAAIVLVAWFGGTFLRRVLQEEMSRSTLLIKGAAIVLVGVGLWFVAG